MPKLRLNSKALFQYQEELNSILTYEEFSVLELKASKAKYYIEFKSAIDICGTAPTRAIFRAWLDGDLSQTTVPVPRDPYVWDKLHRKVAAKD